MLKPIYLSLVFHNHQPVGNFDFISEQGVANAYAPLIDLLEVHPSVHVGLHFSGSLLEWMVERYPTLVDRVRALVLRGQVEILTGGYYEPILTAWSDEDKQGQINKLTEAIQQWLGTRPSGLWLAERVWEPHLVKPLAEAGVKYVIVDDTHFEAVGFDKDKDLFGYFITEEQGHSLAVFPTLTQLRYAIPWGTVEENIDWLRQQAQTGLRNLQPKLAFAGDDGEKFGVWPGTSQHCWDNGYMEALFAAIEENADWLRTITPSAFMEEFPALGRAYLPAASYREMGEWSLPPGQAYELKDLRTSLANDDAQRMGRFLQGGIWRNFMVKYDEINHMHKRALAISKRVHAMPDGPAKQQALDLLWAAQSNDAYWHGVFGGIYLFHFRVENYANLLAAEQLALGESPPLTVDLQDLDMDSNEELILSSSEYYMVWDLARGGTLREWDYRPARYNLLNLMTRRDEGYHQELVAATAENRLILVGEENDNQKFGALHEDIVRVKEPGMERYLIADWYRRGSFIDHFLRSDTTLQGFYRSAYPEQGDCVILPYEADWQVDGDTANVRLQRDTHVWIGESHLPVHLTKEFRVQQASGKVEVTYMLQNNAERAFDVRFAVETALAYDGGDNIEHCTFELDGTEYSLADIAEHEQVTRYAASTRIRDLKTTITISQAANLWRFPLETVTLSEAGFERGYQGTTFLQWWPLHLEAGEVWQVTLTQQTEAL